MQLKASAARHAAPALHPWVTPHQTKEAQKNGFQRGRPPAMWPRSTLRLESPHDVAAGIQGEAAAGFGSMSALPRARAQTGGLGRPAFLQRHCSACLHGMHKGSWDRDSESVHACCRVILGGTKAME